MRKATILILALFAISSIPLSSLYGNFDDRERGTRDEIKQERNDNISLQHHARQVQAVSSCRIATGSGSGAFNMATVSASCVCGGIGKMEEFGVDTSIAGCMKGCISELNNQTCELDGNLILNQAKECCVNICPGTINQIRVVQLKDITTLPSQLSCQRNMEALDKESRKSEDVLPTERPSITPVTRRRKFDDDAPLPYNARVAALKLEKIIERLGKKDVTVVYDFIGNIFRGKRKAAPANKLVSYETALDHVSKAVSRGTCMRSNCAVRITITSRSRIEYKIVNKAVAKLKKSPAFKHVFEFNRGNCCRIKKKAGRRKFVVIINFKAKYLDENFYLP